MFTRRAIVGAGLTLIMAYGAVLHAADASVEHAIAQLEKAVNDAYAANDLDKYFSYYAEDLVAIFYNERWTYARYHEEWPKYVKAGNKVVSVKLSDMIVRVSPAGDDGRGQLSHGSPQPARRWQDPRRAGVRDGRVDETTGRMEDHPCPLRAGGSSAWLSMRNIIGWLSAAILGSAGWWLGAQIGLGLAVVVSAIASGFGLYLGFRWFDQNLK